MITLPLHLRTCPHKIILLECFLLLLLLLLLLIVLWNFKYFVVDFLTFSLGWLCVSVRTSCCKQIKIIVVIASFVNLLLIRILFFLNVKFFLLLLLLLLLFILLFMLFCYFLSFLLVDIEAKSHHVIVFLLIGSVCVVRQCAAVALGMGKYLGWLFFNAFNGLKNYLEICWIHERIVQLLFILREIENHIPLIHIYINYHDYLINLR